MSEAKLSDKLYRWIGENGGWQIGRKVLGVGSCHGPEVALMRCEFGRLYWVYAMKLTEHDTTYREREREAERASVKETQPRDKRRVAEKAGRRMPAS